MVRAREARVPQEAGYFGMTPDDLIELGKRAVACRRWRWMPGMADLWGGRMREGDGLDRMHALPDLTDPATLGCLLALVREAWGDPGMFVRPRGSKMRPDWAVFTGQNSDLVCAASAEAEALVAAWEAAP